MDYKSTIEYLYNATPQFERIGAAAYKPGLDTALALSKAWGDPHRHYPTIHVAGTNGKGSTCHTIAAILQSEGYRVGLYTSPHLVDFRERMRVNGRMISQQEVVDFVERYKEMDLGLSPSFFELTTIMAFDFFARQRVDIAIIETGLGGRLDTTNIISPIMSVITNVSFDHTAQLGNTIESIAGEKAGIIKEGTSVVIGNSSGVRELFEQRGAAVDAPVYFAEDIDWYESAEFTDNGILYRDTYAGDIVGELSGDCQPENTGTIFYVIGLLRRMGMEISDYAIEEGFAHVNELTGFAGRWMKLSDSPLTICDTGHNEGGWRYLGKRLGDYGDKLVMVIGFVNDKDVSHIMELMPRHARYIFTQASIPRSMAAEQVAATAAACGLQGKIIPGVKQAIDEARNLAGNDGVIFIGGSTYVVAEALAK